MIYQTLGLMSGSSLDGLDIAHCSIHWENGQLQGWELQQAETLPFSEQWQRRLRHLPEQNALIFAKTHTYFGHYMGDLVQQFLKKHPIPKLDLIASHGHTIFHHPDQRLSVQIGCGAALAAKTGYTCITDFRTQDVALDGEGAPLAPLADHYLFPGYHFYLNLGGIANLSARTADQQWIAFDIAPANQVLDALAQELGQAYDKDGLLASQGAVQPALLEAVSQFPYYTQAYPKSLGNAWIRQAVLPHYLGAEASWQDKLATATEHLAIEIAQAIEQIVQREQLPSPPYRLLATGGGAFNTYLMEQIAAYCNRHTAVEVYLPKQEMIAFKEAALMALLGVLRLEGQPNSWASVTGAQRDTVNGAVYYGNRTT